MVSRRDKVGPLTPEDFEKAVEEEISISNEFGLPMSVLVGWSEWDEPSVDLAMGVLRAGDLISWTEDLELTIALPNTSLENARPVERRLRGALPGVRVGLSTFEPDDTLKDVLARARAAVSDQV